MRSPLGAAQRLFQEPPGTLGRGLWLLCVPSAPPLLPPVGSEPHSGACPAYLRLTVVHSAGSSGGRAAAAGAGAAVARAAREAAVAAAGAPGRHLCGARGAGVGWAAAALSLGRSGHLPAGILLFLSPLAGPQGGSTELGTLVWANMCSNC